MGDLDGLIERGQDLFGDGVMRRATISADGIYRYRLTRLWDGSRPPLTFVMLNPSTADDRIDDPTIRRCIGFARRENCGGLVVVNLYALRATDPSELRRAADPYGPENDSHLAAALEEAFIRGKPVVCAWGTKGGDAIARFRRLLAGSEAQTVALRLTAEGHPSHPLYIPAATPFVEYLGRLQEQGK